MNLEKTSNGMSILLICATSCLQIFQPNIKGHVFPTIYVTIYTSETLMTKEVLDQIGLEKESLDKKLRNGIEGHVFPTIYVSIIF
jgi:hypothetical protein